MNLFDRNNRIRLKGWISRIDDCKKSTTSLTNLALELKETYLVGSELYKGDLLKNACSQPYGTFQFVSTDVSEKAESLDKAIFQIAPGMDRIDLKSPFITLGRGPDNDITIADYAISKSHCHFTLNQNNKLILTSNSPTNAIKCNGVKMKPDTSIEVNMQDKILLGRFNFSVTNGFELVAQALASISQGSHFIESVYEYVRAQPSEVLQKIAIDLKISGAYKLSKAGLVNVLKKVNILSFPVK